MFHREIEWPIVCQQSLCMSGCMVVRAVPAFESAIPPAILHSWGNLLGDLFVLSRLVCPEEYNHEGMRVRILQ
jgi:hypothetical protein